MILVLVALGLVFYWKANQNFHSQDYKNSNFFFFWLSGRMVWTGENPYNPVQWLAGHDAFGATWKPNQIFPYPLPLMFFLAPLGLLSLGQAYFIWLVLSQVLMAVTVYVLLNHWKEQAYRLFFLPVMLFLLFFGPVYLSLQIGSIGPLTLIILVGAILLLDKQRSFPAGLLLSLTILKPPQGLTLLILAGVWFLARRDWKAIAGLAAGGLALLLIGLARDPLWLTKLGGASQVVLDRTLGIQSNLYSFSYLACSANVPCMWSLGSAAVLLVLGGGAYYLWRNAARLTAWEAFNLIIPLGFLTAIYLWSYDQLPYLIPIVWITGKLIERTRSYLYAILFLFFIDLISLVSLIVQAYTKKDLLSVFTTLVVLGMVLSLMHWKPKNQILRQQTSESRSH